ncbi:MAG: 2-C-methyl-D-erythritol 4-phosphate cytidylyltransferase, partial [Leucobacter sp.]
MSAGSLGVVLVAAGSGTRLGANEPKAFVSVAGRTMLARAIEGVRASSLAAHLVVVVPSAHLDHARRIVDTLAASTPDP